MSDRLVRKFQPRREMLCGTIHVVRSPFLGSPLPSPLLDLREFFIILAPVAAAVEAAAPPDPPNLPSSERDTVRLTRFAFRIIRLHEYKALISEHTITKNKNNLSWNNLSGNWLVTCGLRRWQSSPCWRASCPGRDCRRRWSRGRRQFLRRSRWLPPQCPRHHETLK